MPRRCSLIACLGQEDGSMLITQCASQAEKLLKPQHIILDYTRSAGAGSCIAQPDQTPTQWTDYKDGVRIQILARK